MNPGISTLNVTYAANLKNIESGTPATPVMLTVRPSVREMRLTRIIHTKIFRFVEPTRDSLRLIDM